LKFELYEPLLLAVGGGGGQGMYASTQRLPLHRDEYYRKRPITKPKKKF